MSHGTVSVKLRPIKLAFLVSPNDKDSLLKAIEINTFLWGGIYNPIIPTYRGIPRNWMYPLPEDRGAQSVLSGYLDNFNPDYVVPMGECADYSLEVGHRKRIDDDSAILGPVEERGAPNFGIGLFEVLKHFIEQELKFLRREPYQIHVAHFGVRFRLFLASVFGIFPEQIGTIFWENYSKDLEAKIMGCSASNYAEFLHSRKLFLSRMTNLFLEASGSRKQCVFFMDATKTIDIIDYWNLRAIGRNVIPIPKQFLRSDKAKRLIFDFIKGDFLPAYSAPEVFHDTTPKSRSISEDEHQIFRDTLAEFAFGGNYEKPEIPRTVWYPRIWDEQARD